MFLIIYSGQRYKTNIIKTNLITIIFGWERELEGNGEEGWESRGGRQGRLRSRPTRHCLVEQGQVGTERGQAIEGDKGQLRSKPTRHCLVEQGPLGTDRGPLETEGRLAGNGDRGRLERGQEPLATAYAHYQLSPKSSRQTRSLTLRNGSKYAFLRHDKAGGYNLPRTEHCNAGVL